MAPRCGAVFVLSHSLYIGVYYIDTQAGYARLFYTLYIKVCYFNTLLTPTLPKGEGIPSLIYNITNSRTVRTCSRLTSSS